MSIPIPAFLNFFIPKNSKFVLHMPASSRHHFQIFHVYFQAYTHIHMKSALFAAVSSQIFVSPGQKQTHLSLPEIKVPVQ